MMDDGWWMYFIPVAWLMRTWCVCFVYSSYQLKQYKTETRSHAEWEYLFLCVHFLPVNLCMLWRWWWCNNIILVGIQYSSYVNSTQLSQLHIPSPNHNFLLSPSKQINALSQDKNPGWQSSITFSLSGGRCKTHIIGNNTTKRQFSCRFSLPGR